MIAFGPSTLLSLAKKSDDAAKLMTSFNIKFVFIA
jgi:hypothetical protein